MTTTRALPPATDAGAVLSRALLEALSGRRSVGQLRGHCAPEVFAGLEDLPRIGGRVGPQMLSMWVCEPADGVAEVSVSFRSAGQVRAMALRLQGIDGRWRITVLQVA